MREIKFRAFDLKDSTWLSQQDFAVLGYGKILVWRNGRYSAETGIEVMQFTGLYDKDGKEIYEGDIVKGFFNVDELEDYIYMSLTKKEKETGTKIFIVDTIHFGYEGPIPDILEIIGNIYENSHLLTSQ